MSDIFECLKNFFKCKKPLESERENKIRKILHKFVKKKFSEKSKFAKNYFYSVELEFLDCRLCKLEKEAEGVKDHRCEIDGMNKFSRKFLMVMLFIFRILVKQIFENVENFLNKKDLAEKSKFLFQDLSVYVHKIFKICLADEIETEHRSGINQATGIEFPLLKYRGKK